MGLAASRQEFFWEACGFGQVNKVKKFLEEGIDVNWVSYTHNSCAIHVASQGKTEIVKMLLEAKCDVNVKDERGCLAIHHAAMKGFAEIIKLLHDAGSEINAQDKNGWTPLICAAYWCRTDAVEILINLGCDIHAANKDQRTALHECARCPDTEGRHLGKIAKMLINAGCDINAKSSDLGEADFTPLMFAAYHGHIEVCRELITSGCEISSQGTNGWTSLHWAADRGHGDIVQLLLDSGINASLKGRRGELAVDRVKTDELRQIFPNIYVSLDNTTMITSDSQDSVGSSHEFGMAQPNALDEAPLEVAKSDDTYQRDITEKENDIVQEPVKESLIKSADSETLNDSVGQLAGEVNTSQDLVRSTDVSQVDGASSSECDNTDKVSCNKKGKSQGDVMEEVLEKIKLAELSRKKTEKVIDPSLVPKSSTDSITIGTASHDDFFAGIENVNLSQYLVKRTISKAEAKLEENKTEQQQ